MISNFLIPGNNLLYDIILTVVPFTIEEEKHLFSYLDAYSVLITILILKITLWSGVAFCLYKGQ